MAHGPLVMFDVFQGRFEECALFIIVNSYRNDLQIKHFFFRRQFSLFKRNQLIIDVRKAISFVLQISKI